MCVGAARARCCVAAGSDVWCATHVAMCCSADAQHSCRCWEAAKAVGMLLLLVHAHVELADEQQRHRHAVAEVEGRKVALQPCLL